MGLSGSQISVACREERKTSYGYIWRYVEDKNKNVLPDFEHNGHCVTVYEYDKYTYELLNIYKSIKDASENTGIHCSTISAIAKGERQAIRQDYVWSFTPLVPEQIIEKTKNKINIKINQYTLDGVFLQTYESILAAGEQFVKEHSYAAIGIGSCCKKRHPTMYGYKWFYASDAEQPDKTKILK